MDDRVTNPLPQLVPQRLRNARQRCQAAQWSRSEELAVQGGPVNPAAVPLAEARRQQLAAVKPNSCFGKAGNSWESRWFRLDIPAPRAGEKGRRQLEWACDGEATAWIDGQPWAGLDGPHPTCPLPDRACTVWIDCGCWCTGIWHGSSRPIGAHGLRFEGARLKVRDEDAWGALWDLDVLLQAVEQQLKDSGLANPGSFGHIAPHDTCSPLTRQLLHAIDQALDVFDRDGLRALRRVLAEVFKRFPAESWQPRASLVGHAHIDLVWLWPESATESKGVHTVATTLRLMEKYPEFSFAMSQPALYRAIERLAPGQAAEVRRRIRQGRWQVIGGFEVEPDNNLPSGEALARSLAEGQAKTAALAGHPSPVCWIPDVFGYSAMLPQILRLGGISAFYTTKMTWSAITKFPYNSFVWRGADGSEVLTHLCPNGYVSDVNLGELVGAARNHRQADVHPDVLVCEGFGDGGGGITEYMCERVRRLGDLAGVPKAGWELPEAFFERLDAIRGELPAYQGELYLEYHRGTYTTQGRYKLAYRLAERGLQVHEAVRAALGAGAVDAHDWQRVAFAQFHDAIPGSSIALVYQQLTPELQSIHDRHAAAAITQLRQAGAGTGVQVFNPLPFARTAVVELPAGAEPGGLHQTVGSGRARRTLALAQLAPLASAPPGARTPVVPATAAANLLDNGLVRAVFDRSGRLARLSVAGEDLLLDGPADLRLYADHPAQFDAWDIDHAALRNPVAAGPALALKVVESGPLRAVLRGEAPLGAASALVVDYVLEAGSRWLKVEMAVRWAEDHRLLKFHLPTGYRGRLARFGAPFGSIQRPQACGVAADEAMWEVPAQRWAAVTDETGRGLAVVTEAKYGFSCKDGNLGLSLLRAPGDPDPTADRGDHRIRFAIGRHERAGAGGALATAACADDLFTAPLVVPGGRALAPRFALDQLGSLVPSWVVPAGKGGFTLRLHEVDGGHGAAELTLPVAPAAVELVDFLGNVIGKPKALGGNRWRLDYTPYRILSVRVR
jgi:alpha-mannosidase